MDSEIEDTLKHYQDNQRKAKMMLLLWFLALLIITVLFFWGAKEYTQTQNDLNNTKDNLLKLEAEVTEVKERATEDQIRLQAVINEVYELRDSIKALSSINNDAQKALYVAQKYLHKTPLTSEEKSILDNAYQLDPALEKTSGEVALLRGILSVNNGALQDALDYFDEVKDTEALQYYAHWAIGHVYFKQKMFQKAQSEYNLAVQTTEQSVKAGVLVDRGLTWVRLHTNDVPLLTNALADYNQAVELGNSYPVVYRRRGLVELRMNNVQRATADFDRAVSRSATDEELASAIENLGLVSIHQQSWNNAIDQSKLVLKVYPESNWNWAIRTIAANKLSYDVMKECSLIRWIEEGGDPSSSLRYYLPKVHWDYLTGLYEAQNTSNAIQCNP
ncbi:tetratricopeptide repeat protein [Glaciecola sp. 2405UD65-10]|uniref:tetratricopeptide repeat protein n=1 Tax=Glaciecola sp. 2405UD65-10 TaxID=3397244 RepID=UPI003B5AA024